MNFIQQSVSQLQQVRQQGQTSRFSAAKLGELLNSKFNEDLLEALKILIVIYLQNRDMSPYISRIINMLPREDLEIKRICQILITEIAAELNNKSQQGDILLLSISPIFKDIVSFNTGTKLYSLKTLPLMHVVETAPLVMASLKQIMVDKNPLVRRTAATTILKLNELTHGDIEEDDYQDVIEFLLKDTPQVRIAAVNTLLRLNKDHNLNWAHQKFYVLIKDLPSLNNFDLERAIRFLHRYALQYFSFCKDEVNQKSGVKIKDFEDLQLLLDQTEKILKLPYPAVVVAVTALHLDFPQESRLKRIARILIRFLNISSESKYVILQIIYRFAQSYPQLFRDHFRAFTINQIEKLYCKIRKLEILQLLIDENNFSIILEELLHHTKSNQPQLVATAVRLLGCSAQLIPKQVKRTIKALVDVLRNGTKESKNYAVDAFCRIMNELQSPQLLPLLTLCLQYLDEITDIRFKSYVIRLLNRELQIIPTIAAENLRKLALQFLFQHENIKYEILQFANALNEYYQKNYHENTLYIKQIYEYLITLSQFDSSILLRDLARSLENIHYPLVQDEAQIHRWLSGAKVKSQSSQKTQKTIFSGYLSDFIDYEMKLDQRKQVLLINTESTSELRKIVLTPTSKEEIKLKQIQPNQSQTQKPPQQTQTQNQNPLPQTQNIPEDQKKKKKQIDEEVKKHYGNLNSVLDDFFVDEE